MKPETERLKLVFYFTLLIILFVIDNKFRISENIFSSIPHYFPSYPYYVIPFIIYFLISYPIFFLILRKKFTKSRGKIDARVYSPSVSLLAIAIPFFLYTLLAFFYASTGYLEHMDVENLPSFDRFFPESGPLKFLRLLVFLFGDFGKYFLSLSLAVTMGFIIAGIMLMSYGKFTERRDFFILLKFGLITTFIHFFPIILASFALIFSGR